MYTAVVSSHSGDLHLICDLQLHRQAARLHPDATGVVQTTELLIDRLKAASSPLLMLKLMQGTAIVGKAQQLLLACCTLCWNLHMTFIIDNRV